MGNGNGLVVTPDMNTGKIYATARDISSLVKLKSTKERRELKAERNCGGN